MNLRIYLLVVCAYSIGITAADKAWRKDEIYIDDELEGSGGGHREFGKDDLESSGSGMGPDDEDGDGSGEHDGSVDTSFKPAFNPPPAPNPPAPDGVPVDPQPPSQPEEPTHTDVNPDKTEKPARPETGSTEHGHTKGTDNHDVLMENPEERATSFFAQPGILAAVIGGCVVGLLCAILVVMFIVYRMRKKDEGSYPLDEPKRSPTANSYTKNSQREFYA